MYELSQCISEFCQHDYSYFDTASFILFCLQEDKLLQFSSMDKSSIWQVLTCVSFLKCKDGRAAIIKMKFTKPQKRN